MTRVLRVLLVSALLATYVLVAPSVALADDETYSLTLNANGGTFGDDAVEDGGSFVDTPINSILAKTYAALANLDRPTRPYLRLTGWATSALATDARPQILPWSTASATAAYPGGRDHDGLADYTIQELSAVSGYLSDLYGMVGGDTSDPLYSGDKVYQEFHDYLTEGQTWEPRGDRGTILTITGQTGNYAHLEFRIAGINHDELANRKYEDGSYARAGLTFLMTHRLPDAYKKYMNQQNHNNGGWRNSYMRMTWLAEGGTVWNVLPAELTSAIVEVRKPNDSSYGGTTVDKLWLPSFAEVAGNTTINSTQYVNKNSTEGRQYECVGTNASADLKKMASTYHSSSASRTFLRSPAYGADNGFWSIQSNGNLEIVGGSLTDGVTFGFSL